MKARKFGGLAVLVVVALIVAGFSLWPAADPDGPSPKELTVSGIVGGKVAFMEDAEVKKILKDKYGLTVEYERVGSIDQVPRCVAGLRTGLDFCWPSSETARQLIQQQIAPATVKYEVIFNSPIVVYTWASIAEALIAQGIVRQDGATYYLVDFAKLVQLIVDHTPWAEIGLPKQYGNISIISSDPTESNTGNSYAALLANTLNGGQVVDQVSVEQVLSQVQSIIFSAGLLPSTTTQLFEQFLALGIGAYPIIVAYESNLIELLVQGQSPAVEQRIRTEVRTLYPQPTLWSSHPLLALTEGGERLLGALRDPEIQRIGWEKHGFRSAIPNIVNDPAAVPLPGVPATIDSIIPMPNPATMERIIEALQGTPTAAVKPDQAFV